MNTYTVVCINTYVVFIVESCLGTQTISMGLWKPCKHFSYFKSMISPPLLYMLSISLLALGVHGAGYSKSLGTWLLHTAWEVFMQPAWMHPLIPGTPWQPQLGKEFPPCQGCITELPGASSVTCTTGEANFSPISKKRGKCSIKYLQRMGLDCRNICYQSYIPRGFHSQTASPLQRSCHTGLYNFFFSC